MKHLEAACESFFQLGQSKSYKTNCIINKCLKVSQVTKKKGSLSAF